MSILTQLIDFYAFGVKKVFEIHVDNYTKILKSFLPRNH